MFAYDNASLSTNKSVAITIANSAPTAPSVNLTPDAPTTVNELYCNVTANSTDADNDTVNYTYTWRKDNVINRTFGLTYQLYDMIGSGNTSHNEVWNCTVTPFDGTTNGTDASDKATIANTAPTHTTPVLSSSAGTNYTNESLTCYNQSTNDIDNDAVTNYYKWFRNNTIVENETTSTLSYTNSSKNDSMVCEIALGDGTGNGTALNSTSLKIRNYWPVFNTTISNITWNENTNLINNLTLSNYFYDIDNDELAYNVAGNFSIRVVINSTTKNVSFYPAANWNGVEYVVFTAADDEHNASSNNITLTVTNVPRCGDGSCDAGETCSACSTDCGSCVVVAPVIEGAAAPVIAVQYFTISQNSFYVELIPGQTKIDYLSIKNTGMVSLEFTIDTKSLNDLVLLSESSFVLDAGETKKIKIAFTAENREGTYSDNIIIKGGLKEKLIPTTIHIAKKPLFDVKADVLDAYKEVKAGEDVKFNITLYNIGGVVVDTKLDYSIRDLNGNIITAKHETLAIEREATITRSLAAPIEPGDYIFYAQLAYGDSIATSSDSFKVVKEMLAPPKDHTILLIIVLIILIITLILGYYKKLSQKLRLTREPRVTYEEEQKKRSMLRREIKRIEVYIIKELKKGFAEKQIKTALLDIGWPVPLVDTSFNSVHKKFLDKSIFRLRRYTKKQLKKGFSKDQIKERILAAGWPKRLVDKLFQGIK